MVIAQRFRLQMTLLSNLQTANTVTEPAIQNKPSNLILDYLYFPDIPNYSIHARGEITQSA